MNLLQKLSAHSSHTAYKEVEHLVFRKEERVVYYVECLAQIFAVYYKRDVGLRCTLRTCYHTDTASAKSTEEFAGNTRCVLHVLAYNSYCSQSALSVHWEHGTRLYLLGKLVVEHLYSSLRVLIAHADRRRVL